MKNTVKNLVVIDRATRTFGFNWLNVEMILDQIMSECNEVRSALKEEEPNHRIQEEVGDLLHAVISLCIFAGYDVDQILTQATEKFRERASILKMLTKAKGLKTLQGQPSDFLIELWQNAKKICDKQN